MKNIILIIIFSTLALETYSQTTKEIFAEANSLYKQGVYDEALNNYQKIVDMGYQSADLYFNLGNCFYKLDKIAPAILYFKRAIKLEPNMDDAKFNLKMARKKTVDKIEEIPKTFIAKFWKSLTSIMTIYHWSILSIVLAFFSSISFLIYFFSNNSSSKMVNFVISLSTFFIMIISIVIAKQQTVWQKKHKEAVIMTKNSYVKVAPTQNSGDSFILHEGTEILVVDEIDEWLRVKLLDGKIGWIHSDDISYI